MISNGLNSSKILCNGWTQDVSTTWLSYSIGALLGFFLGYKILEATCCRWPTCTHKVVCNWVGIRPEREAQTGVQELKAPLKVQRSNNNIKQVNEQLLERLLCAEAVWKVQSWCWTSSMPRWLSREVPDVSYIVFDVWITSMTGQRTIMWSFFHLQQPKPRHFYCR